jgi:Flp pilus assembly protein TadD
LTLLGVALVVAVAVAGCASGGSQRKSTTRDEILQIRGTMAETLVQQGDYEHGLPYLKDLIAQYPADAKLRLLLGIVLREKGIFAPAEKEIRLAIRLSPRSPEPYSALGVLLDKMSRPNEAEKDHREAVRLAPGSASFRNNLGFNLFLQRRYKEAQEEILEAIRLDPGLRRAYNNLGFVYGLTDDSEAALKAFSQAGSRAMALTNMGVVEEMRGQPGSARRYYERALRAQRGYAPAVKNLRALEPQVASPPEDTAASDGEEQPGEKP